MELQKTNGDQLVFLHGSMFTKNIFSKNTKNFYLINLQLIHKKFMRNSNYNILLHLRLTGMYKTKVLYQYIQIMIKL